jgi:hypothetical protein
VHLHDETVHQLNLLRRDAWMALFTAERMVESVLRPQGSSLENSGEIFGNIDVLARATVAVKSQLEKFNANYSFVHPDKVVKFDDPAFAHSILSAARASSADGRDAKILLAFRDRAVALATVVAAVGKTASANCRNYIQSVLERYRTEVLRQEFWLVRLDLDPKLHERWRTSFRLTADAYDLDVPSIEAPPKRQKPWIFEVPETGEPDIIWRKPGDAPPQPPTAAEEDEQEAPLYPDQDEWSEGDGSEPQEAPEIFDSGSSEGNEEQPPSPEGGSGEDLKLDSFRTSVESIGSALGEAGSVAFGAYAGAMEQAFATGQFSARGIGKSARESTKQSLATIGKESAVRGLFEIGYGIKAFATGDSSGGKKHMLSAAQYMAVAALTTGAGGALGGDKGGSGGKKKRDEVEPSGADAGGTKKGRVIQHITVIGNPTNSSAVVH